MIMFLIISILMVIAIIFIFYPFIMKMPEAQVDEHLAQNVQAHEQRLLQIQMQLDGGLFDEEEAKVQQTQSARQLLKDEAQSKRVNTEIKSYMNLPVIMSVVLVALSIFFYMQKGYQLDLKVAQLQEKYDQYESDELLNELLTTKNKLLEKSSRTTAIQWHELGVQQMAEGLNAKAQESFEKSFKMYVETPDFIAEEAAYLKARVAHIVLIQKSYKPDSLVNELLAESAAFAPSNLATQLNQYINSYNKVENNDAAVAIDYMRLGAMLYEYGEFETAKPYILEAAEKSKVEANNPGLTARAYAVAAQITVVENDNNFNDEVLGHLNNAMQHNPSDYLVLQLTGEFAYGNKEYDIAYQTWSVIMSDPSYASIISQDLFDKYQVVLKKLGKSEEIKGLVTVNVDIDDSLKALASKGEYLFVLARPIGQRMPLAVKKIPMSEVTFPLTVTLSDRDAMTAEMTISSQEKFEIVARVSLSGIANAAKGEPESEALQITKDTKDVSIKINTIH